jgi:hypothetical protein
MEGESEQMTAPNFNLSILSSLSKQQGGGLIPQPFIRRDMPNCDRQRSTSQRRTHGQPRTTPTVLLI